MTIIEGIVTIVGIIGFTAFMIFVVSRSQDSADYTRPTKPMHTPGYLWTSVTRPSSKCPVVKILPDNRAKICTRDADHEMPHEYVYVSLDGVEADDEG